MGLVALTLHPILGLNRVTEVGVKVVPVEFPCGVLVEFALGFPLGFS